MASLKLYDYSASANCYKVRLLLAQLERPYERVPIDIFDGDTLTDEYGRINPHRTTPVLELPEGEHLTESAAILTYLATGTSLLPSEPLAMARVLSWLVYEQTDVIPAIGGLRFRLQTGRLEPDDPGAIERREAGEELLPLLDRHLAEQEFFAGPDYTIADVAMFGYLHVAEEAGYDLAEYPSLVRWLARVTQQPGFIDDLAPYPENARPGRGRSTYG
jgi:glutathione S-transferase